MVDDALIDLGYRYRSGSIVEDGLDDGAPWDDPRTPSGQPGVHAPHVAVRRAGAEVSTLDLIGRQSVLFTASDGDAWERAAGVAAERLGVPLSVCHVGDPQGEFVKAYGLGTGGATLVRPDGVVAWRAREAVDDATNAIGAALARTLCRSWPR